MDYICLFSKPPIPGQTKTRLAMAIGPQAAAELACAMLRDICALILNVEAAVPQLWYPPETSPKDFHDVVPARFTFQKQCGNDLGERMCYTFAQLLSAEANNRVIIIGSDCITHTPSTLRAAFSDLDSHSVIIQPSTDGGYVLMGQSRWCPEVFKNIEWGCKHVYANSIKKMRKAGISFRKLASTFDVDYIEDLKKVRKFIKTVERPHIFAWMKRNDWI